MADQYKECPQCGGTLVILDDDRRQCQDCGMKYTLVNRLVSDSTVPAVRQGEPVTDQYKECPQCGGTLVMLNNGKRQCQNCGMKYVLVKRSSFAGDIVIANGATSSGSRTVPVKATTAGKKRKKRSYGLVLIALLILLVGAGGYLAYHWFFDGGKGNTYIENDDVSDSGSMSISAVSSGEAAEGLEIKTGSPLYVFGIVEDTGENFIRLNNGVTCYFNPEIFDRTDQLTIQYMLSSQIAGSTVGISGLVSDPSAASFTMEDCSIPYFYYDEEKYYNEYENFRKGIPYPDTAYSDISYNNFKSRVSSGDMLSLSAVNVINGFEISGIVSSSGFFGGELFYEKEQVLQITGSVEKTEDGYFVVDGISCFYEWDLLSEEEREAIDSLQVNDTVTVCGSVCNPSANAFRMKYCYIITGTADNNTDTSPDSLYQEAIRQEKVFWIDSADTDNMSASYVTSGYFDDGIFGYHFVDIDGNGVDEMLFEFGNYPGNIYAIYTICDDQLICLIRGFQSDRYGTYYSVYPDGKIAVKSYGVGYHAIELYQFPINGTSLEFEDAYFSESEWDENEGYLYTYWHSSDVDFFDFDNHIGYSQISEEEFNNVYEEYIAPESAPPELIPIAQLPELAY